tara:strand:- start:225 stop:869 length:645 start_codon:yes stop_codon:yes gene_type:complete
MALSKIQAESMNLADTFAFTGTVSGASDLELLNTTTSTDGVNTIELNDIFSTTYRYYKIVCTDLALKEGTGNEHDGDAKLYSRIKLSGQSSYDSGSSNYTRRSVTFSNANNNYSGNSSGGASDWLITPSGAVEDGQYNSYPMNIKFDVYNPSSTNTSQAVYMRFELSYYSYHPYRIGNWGHLFHANNNWTGLSLFWGGSGQFHAGAVFKVYGFK